MVDYAKIVPELKEIPKEYHEKIADLLQRYYDSGVNAGKATGRQEGYEGGYEDGLIDGAAERVKQ